MGINISQKDRLRGRAILLSASVPSLKRADIYKRIETAEAIEEAVVSLARAVFSEGGTLVFGGHPTISPLVALVVREYLVPRVAESFSDKAESEDLGPHVDIYQSEAYRKKIAEATHRLKQQPGVTIHWVKAVGGEIADPEVHDRPQVPESLQRMRMEMIKQNNLVGMVCIGGMEGVEEEAKLFYQHREKLPIYALESTGGATRKLAQYFKGERCLRLPEEGIQKLVEEFWHKHKRSDSQKMSEDRPEQAFVFPYAYVAQKIVAEIIDSGKSDHPNHIG